MSGPLDIIDFLTASTSGLVAAMVAATVGVIASQLIRAGKVRREIQSKHKDLFFKIESMRIKNDEKIVQLKKLSKELDHDVDRVISTHEGIEDIEKTFEEFESQVDGLSADLVLLKAWLEDIASKDQAYSGVQITSYIEPTILSLEKLKDEQANFIKKLKYALKAISDTHLSQKS